MKTKTLAAAIALVLTAPTLMAQSSANDAPVWKGTGELGYVSASGNSRSDSINAKLGAKFEDSEWKHDMFVAGIRQRGEVVFIDVTDPDNPQRRMVTNANRYELGGTTARKLDDRNSLFASLRYENDDFAPYEYQGIVAVGWGHQLIRSERTNLAFEVGPGYKRVKEVITGDTNGFFVGRGKMDFEHKITDNTSIIDSLLVEAGSDNTFIQNDLGLKVAMNASFAIKAGLQHRHNTDVAPGIKKTDRLTTLNLVYDF